MYAIRSYYDTGIINRFDKVSISINGIGIISGEVDRVIYQYGSDNNTIQVNGRDMAHILIDNDALPSTLYSINPSKYIISKCSEYGIKCNINSNTTTINKLIIGTSESEISIMNNLLINDRHRLWYIYDTLYSGKWSTSDAHSYTFTRGVNYGTHIKSLSLTEDGTDTKSEIKIYGSRITSYNVCYTKLLRIGHDCGCQLLMFVDHQNYLFIRDGHTRSKQRI